MSNTNHEQWILGVLVCARSGHGHAVRLDDDSHPASSPKRVG